MPQIESRGRATTVTLVLVALLATALWWVGSFITPDADAFSRGITGRSGQQGTTCASCHTTGDASVQIRGALPVVVDAGVTVPIFIDVSSRPGDVKGFNLSIDAGTLQAPNGSVQIINGEATHTTPSTEQFQVDWSTPTEPGTYQLWLAVVSANGDGRNGAGDVTVSTVREVTVREPQSGDQCNGQTPTVIIALGQQPTSGDDVILGTPGDDEIAAGDGDDVICGLGGNDTIWGQNGEDHIEGGDGDDRLRGGADNDTVLGGDGADDLGGGSGDDMVDGGNGDDPVVRGNGGDDQVFGGPGDDAIVNGNGGSDTVDGGPGNDKVIGGPRPDIVRGGDGNDIIRGLNGADTLDGGDGDDQIFGGKSPDTIDGGLGTDECNGGTTGENGGIVAFENDSAINCEQVVSVP